MIKVQISGSITTIFPSEIFGSNFEKRLLWVQEDNQKYPNEWQLEMHQGDCNLLDGFKPGDKVICEVDVRGKKFSKGGRDFVFNALKVVSISKAQGGNNLFNKQEPAATTHPTFANETLVNQYRDAPDDLPF